MVSVHSLKLRGEGHRVSAGGPAQPGPVCSVPPGPLTCRLPGTLPGSPAPPGQRPGAAHNSSTLWDKAEGSVSFGATVLFRGGGQPWGPQSLLVMISPPLFYKHWFSGNKRCSVMLRDGIPWRLRTYVGGSAALALSLALLRPGYATLDKLLLCSEPQLSVL